MLSMSFHYISLLSTIIKGRGPSFLHLKQIKSNSPKNALFWELDDFYSRYSMKSHFVATIPLRKRRD